MDNLFVAPSTDPVKTVDEIIDYANDIKDVADFLHCDIMDGVFVDNKTYSYDVLGVINDQTLLPLDVHLMVNNPHKLIRQFIKNGANILTIHYEAYKNKNKLIKDLKLIRKLGALSGISLKPQTSVSEIIPYLSYCDLVLVMSVEPGKSGQTFIEKTFDKVNELNKLREEYNSNFKIEVDGGVNPEISKKLNLSGVNIVVSGNFVYKNEDKKQAICQLKQ